MHVARIEVRYSTNTWNTDDRQPVATPSAEDAGFGRRRGNSFGVFSLYLKTVYNILCQCKYRVRHTTANSQSTGMSELPDYPQK